jgi:large subunit ribosomal protein L9
VKIARSFGDEGKMYGSVTSKDITEAFEKAGISFDRKQIQLAEPIKTLGTVEVPLKLHGSVSVTLKVEVVKK